MTLIYVTLLWGVVVGFCSMGVDWGRVQLIKTQLQRAADAASRAAVAQLPNGVTAAQNAAVTYGGYNTADGTSVVIDPNNDVEFGTWNTSNRTFTVLAGAARSSANALRVTARRTAANGNAVPLTFAVTIGRSSVDVNARVIALATIGSQPYGIVGLNGMTLNSTGFWDSYDSSAGLYSAGSAHSKADAASNSDINIQSGTVKGDAHPGTGHNFNGNCTGNNSQLTSTLSYPAVTVGAYDNAALPGAYFNGTDFSISGSGVTATIPAGTYYVRDFIATGHATVNFTGSATVYVYGTFNVNNSTVNAYQHRPPNLRFMFTSAATMQMRSSASVEAILYGPQIPFSITGASDVYGDVCCSSLAQSGTGNIHMDESGTSLLGGNGTASYSTVK